MAHLSSNMPDARMVPPHQHMTMESPARSFVLAPLSTTTSSQPTALRRASYIRVADLVKAFKAAQPQRKVSICASLLQSLSLEVLPALVILADSSDLGLVVAHRTPPSTQMETAVKVSAYHEQHVLNE